MAKLTEKQKKFCNEYLIDLNASQAYKRAGYQTKDENVAAVMGSRLLRNDKVSAYLQDRKSEREARTEITQDRVLRELAAIGFADVVDYATVVEKEAVDPDTGYKQMRQSVEIALTKNISKQKRSAIAGIKMGTNGIEIKLNDKLKALELLGKHLGMFNDKPVNPSDEAETGVVEMPAVLSDEGGDA